MLNANVYKNICIYSYVGHNPLSFLGWLLMSNMSTYLRISMYVHVLTHNKGPIGLSSSLGVNFHIPLHQLMNDIGSPWGCVKGFSYIYQTIALKNILFPTLQTQIITRQLLPLFLLVWDGSKDFLKNILPESSCSNLLHVPQGLPWEL
mgnify:CR=1 FL=1